MKRRLIIVYLLLVLLPLGLLAGLGVTLARGERQRLRQHVQDLLMTQLHDVDAQLARFMQSRERQLAELTQSAGLEPDALRARARALPWAGQVFLIQPDGTLRYPAPGGPLSDAERAFLDRIREPWARGDLFLKTAPLAPENQVGLASFSNAPLPAGPQPPAPAAEAKAELKVASARQSKEKESLTRPGPGPAPGPTPNPARPPAPAQRLGGGRGAGGALAPRAQRLAKTTQDSLQAQSQMPAPQGYLNNGSSNFNEPVRPATALPPASGWFGWYWGSGLNLLYWNRHADGSCAGVELDRTRLLADLIGQLPDTDPQRAKALAGCYALRDSNNSLLYVWGAYKPAAREAPAATLALSPPLGSWRLECTVPAGLLAGGGGGLLFSLLAGLAATGVALIGLAVYFYRESTREIREAGQRVSFVNQVSHELKTPLTNIRLYAELLQERTDEEDETAARHLGVIVAESERLSRLIGNVLTFSRGQRGILPLHRAPGRAGEIVRQVVERFGPCLARKGIAVRCLAAGEEEPGPLVMIAGDAVEQILGNLLNNVEKYAEGGGAVEVECHCADSTTTITVADHGPGIPPAEREKIFRPFYRISSSLTEGVSGAGIGLAIARELARRHGGELTLTPSAAGARFEIRLHTPPVGAGG